MTMSRRTVYTIITPLPPQISRETVLAAFHDHGLMIELNPMVINHFPVKPPRIAEADEYHSAWYEIHDKIHYAPGGMVSGKVVYYACLHDLPNGLQTHCYAALGTDIRGKWLLCGSLPGEAPEQRELGVDVPSSGLYVREDIDMKTNFLMTGFVKKNLQKAHSALLERLIVGVGIVETQAPHISPNSTSPISRSDTVGSFGSSGYQPQRPVPSPMLARQSMRDVVEQRQGKQGHKTDLSPSSTYSRPVGVDPGPADFIAELPGHPEAAELDSTQISREYKPAIPLRNPERTSGDRLSSDRHSYDRHSADSFGR